MNPRAFGPLPSGESIEAHTLANASGASVQVLTYGGIVTSLRVPDRRGRFDDVVLGFDHLAPYVARHPYFGAITGRIAGRIAAGRLQVEGRAYMLACNDGPNHLHGGHVGLDKRVWTARPMQGTDGAASLRLTYRSPDGEEGYPGNVDIAVTYTLTAGNAFVVETSATADRVTPLSLAHHSYFNLAGEGSGTIADHEVEIFADAYVPADNGMVLSGRREAVAAHGNDFNHPRRLGDALPHLFKAHGDLYLLRGADALPPADPTLSARVFEPQSGRVLEVFTNESCLQFYSGSALDGSCVGKSGRAYGPHAGLCLECQGYPEGSSRPAFGDILIRPGQAQRRRTIYAFSTR
jgi:aldose 1-epimerase